MKHLGRKLLLPVAAVALAGGSFAFLASNTVADSHAGQGVGTIAGYDVSNIHYEYNATNQIDKHGNGDDSIYQVTFTLDQQASEANAVITSTATGDHASTSYTFGCTAPGAQGGVSDAPAGTVWTCVSASDAGGRNYVNYAPNTGAKYLTVSAAE
jgi:hypothetical protein